MSDNIKPDHYKKEGGKDLFDLWYEMYTPEQYAAGMEMIAMRYLTRRKKDRVEDLNKAIETISRLKDKEEEELSRKPEVYEAMYEAIKEINEWSS